MYALIPVDGRRETVRDGDWDNWDRGDTSTDWVIEDSFRVVNNLDGVRGVGEYVPINFTPEEGQVCYLLYAIWDTGDSFGRDDRGGFEVIALFKDEDEAWAAERSLRREKNFSANITVGGKTFPVSIPWNGYFERLVELDVKQVICEG